MAHGKTKLVLIVRNAMPYDFGGAERFPVDLARELSSNGWRTLVVSANPKLLEYAKQAAIPAKKGWWWQQQNWSGYRALFFPAYLGWQTLLFFWYVFLIGRLSPRVVHLQSKDDFIAGTLAARFWHKRVIWTDHADLKYVFANHKVWYKNPVGKLVYFSSRFADAITLVSESEHKLISNVLGKEAGKKFVVVHNGVNIEDVKHFQKASNEINKFIFCATSRLVTAKGIGELIEAFGVFIREQPDSMLWFVGDGPEAKKFRDMAKGIDGVKFIGHKEDPLPYVATADVFVHPSYHEGFSLSLVEAAALGKPIIACAVGGNPEIILNGVTGLLVESASVESLLTAMQTIRGDTELRASLGKNAKKLYEDKFRFDKIVKEKFLPLYE